METPRDRAAQIVVPVAVIALVCLAIFALVVLWGSASAANNQYVAALLEELAKTALQVVFIGIVGVFAKYLFDQYADGQRRKLEDSQRKQAAEADLRKARIEALNSLTGSYWQIKKALHLIAAFQSASSYRDGMKEIIDRRLELQQLNNAIAADLYRLSGSQNTSQALNRLDDCLEKLVIEFQDHYFELSHLQKIDETKSDPKERKVPSEMQKLEQLQGIMRDEFEAIHPLFEEAVKPFREALALQPGMLTGTPT